MRPALSITSASIRPARRAPSAVADIASSRSSGRSTRCRSQAQRQRQIGFQRTLVHLVQDHGGDAVEPGIGLQPADQQALGDDLDAGRRRDGGIQPGAVADGAADRLAEQRGHAGGGGAGREPARLQHQDACRRRAMARRASASGTSVVLPAPGGATSTTLRPAASAASSGGMASVTGSSGSFMAGDAGYRRGSAPYVHELRAPGETMPRTLRRRSCCSCCCFAWPCPAGALESAPVTSARATASLVSDTDAVAPGTPFRVGLRLRLAPGWHTYWQNPGDAGVPPELELDLPPGATAGPIVWPTPQRVAEGALMTYAYTGDVLLPVTVTPGQPTVPPLCRRTPTGWCARTSACRRRATSSSTCRPALPLRRRRRRCSRRSIGRCRDPRRGRRWWAATERCWCRGRS